MFECQEIAMEHSNAFTSQRENENNRKIKWKQLKKL